MLLNVMLFWSLSFGGNIRQSSFEIKKRVEMKRNITMPKLMSDTGFSVMPVA